jgi:antitoxin-like ribbon-helix-helix protein
MPNTDKDRIAFTFWAPPEQKDAIKGLSARTGKSIQDLMVEALRDLIDKHATAKS